MSDEQPPMKESPVVLDYRGVETNTESPAEQLNADNSKIRPLPLVVKNDEGPFFFIGPRFAATGTDWKGPCLLTKSAVYLFKVKEIINYYKGGIAGAVLVATFAPVREDVRTCTLVELSPQIQQRLRYLKKATDVIVLPKASIRLIELGLNNYMTVHVGEDRFGCVTSIFKGKLRRFLQDEGWVINREQVVTDGQFHRPEGEQPTKGRTVFWRAAIFLTWILLLVTACYLAIRFHH